MKLIRLMLAVACVVPAAARAQEIAYPGVAWGTSGSRLTLALEARGFASRGMIEAGDLAFIADDGTQLQAQMRADRVVGILRIEPGDSAAARFRMVADSLRAALGAPVEGYPTIIRWQAGLGHIRLELGRNGPLRFVRTHWRGPGWYDEMARRDLLGLPEQPPAFTIVTTTLLSLVAVDTASVRAGPGGTVHGRFRIQYPRAVGDVDAEFEAVEYEMDFDCAAGRARLLSRSTYSEGQLRLSDRHERTPWATVPPGGHYARGLDAVCRVRAAQSRNR